MSVDSIAATIRQWPYAIEHGTYHLLFKRRTDLRETADGPPIYAGGGFVFGPTGEALTDEQYQEVCDLLEAAVAEDATATEEELDPAPTLTPAERKRAAIRAKSEDTARRAGGY